MDKSGMEVLLSLSNLLLLLGNIWWQFSFKKVNNQNQLIETLTEEAKASEIIIRDLKRKKDEYKRQFGNLSVEHERVLAELKTYKTMHNHPLVS